MTRFTTRWGAALAGSVLLVGAAVAGAPAQADTAPTNPNDPATPPTVSADALPTVQVNGVVWQQVVVGTTVYVAGSFTKARPAGSAPGVNEVTRNNLLAYDITTGVLKPWAPSLNAQALSITRSPDGARIYVGGDFTAVNGTTRSRIAALDPTSGALIGAFNTRSDAKVRAIAATASTVYFGGLTSNVGGVARTRAAAVRASDGALLPWAPSLTGGSLNALAVSPDGTSVAVGGSFTRTNNSSNPGYGMALVDATTAGLKPFAANAVVRNGGSQTAITSFASSGGDLYGSGYTFGSGGNLEGLFRASWTGGTLQWADPCTGDSYSVYPRGNDVYKASHTHSCEGINGAFGNRAGTWWFWNATAYSKAANGVSRSGPFLGQPAPALLHFFPEFVSGTVTGQNQATWSVTGSGDYVVYGGEFPSVNGTPQQGLVRFAAKNVAPNKQGGRLTGSKLNPTLTANGGGAVTVTWPSNWDRDNRTMTYKVIRDGNTTTPRYTVAGDSSFWNLPTRSWQDTGLTAGQTYRYRVFSVDAFGNETRSDTVTVTAQ